MFGVHAARMLQVPATTCLMSTERQCMCWAQVIYPGPAMISPTYRCWSAKQVSAFICSLSDQASVVRYSVQVATKDEYDKVIQETEAAYLKILESSQTLLTVLKRESINIQKKCQATS